MPTATTSSIGNDMVSKYGFLLQPIRDLTKNWDIDVAAQLEEYLNEIEKIQISFDGGKTTMNFAEAALVIQGSACIYSKKVEYLYTLVYQTLDLIASKKRLQQAASVNDKGQDKDVSVPQEEEFLLLDDIQESNNIDLKDDNVENEASRIIPRTPLALIPLGERDRQDMLLSQTGEVLGSRNDFKMNTCTVHASGALLLDLGNLTLADSSFKRLVTSTPQSPGLGVIQGIASDSQQNDQLPVEPDEHFAAPDINMGNDDDGDDDAAAAGGEEMYDGCVGDYQEAEQEPEKMELRNRDRQQQQHYHRQKLQVQDSWELLDPHNPGKQEQKPFKKGRSFKLPASLMEVSKKENKKRKRNETIEKKQVLIPIQEFCTTAFHSHASKFPKNPLKALVYKEFEYLYWIEFRRRQELEKKQKKCLAEYLTQDQIEDLNSVLPEYKEQEQPEGDISACGPEGNDDYADDDEDNNGFGGPENIMADNDNCIAPEEIKEELVVSGYEDLVRRYVEGYLLEAQHYAKETDLSQRVHEWEERILPTLELEETHRAFDIHLYGSEILASFQDEEAMPFSEIMKNKEPYEICRYFLAALQLANNYNVEVSTEDTKVDTMKLKLQHKTAARDAIRNYRAPSVMA